MSKSRPDIGTRSSSAGNARAGKGETASRSASDSKQRGKQPQKSAFVDIIDQLDLTGLGMSVHHSGPFDAARSKTRADQPAPIAAFSRHALDPAAAAVSSNGADLAPLRDSYVPNATGSNGTGRLSERAKAALSSAHGGSYGDGDYDASQENLLGNSMNGGRSGRSRRDSDSSITLGHPGQYGSARTEKERQYLEAFGVHNEAYEDYGNSRYARKPPRASVYPSAASTATLGSMDKGALGGSGGKSGVQQQKSRSELRGDRTASIWDIEATLREGRPVGAAPPPPMPVMPDQFAASTSSSGSGLSSPQASTSVKRSKSLIQRMRSKKTPISSPQQQQSSAYSDGLDEKDGSFSSSPGKAPLAPTLAYDDYNSSGGDTPGTGGMPSPSPSPGLGGREKNSYFSNSSSSRNEEPTMYPRRTTSNTYIPGSANSKLSPINGRAAMQRSSPASSTLHVIDTTLSPTNGARQGANASRTPSPREKPPVSPLGLPEAGDYFPRSGKYHDLANESATAAFLAESSSKESGMSSTSSSEINNSYNAQGTSADNSFASSVTSSGTTARNGGYGGSTSKDSSFARGGSEERDENMDNTGSPGGGAGGNRGTEKKVSRKPSLVGRLLRGGKKKNAAA